MLAQLAWLTIAGGIFEFAILALWLAPKPHATQEKVELYG
jgi:hypothetical protein